MKTLFFAPHAAIHLHSSAEIALARETKRIGRDVVIVGCGRTFSSYCIPYSANGLEFEGSSKRRNRICGKCERTSHTMARMAGVRRLSLDAFAGDGDEAFIKALDVAGRRADYLDIELNGVDIGRLAVYEALLNFKKRSTSFTAGEWPLVAASIENAARSLLRFQRIFEDERPSEVVFYSPQYGVNAVAAEFARQQGARAIFVEGSLNNAERYDAVHVWDYNRHGLVNPALAAWRDTQPVLEIEDVERVEGHFRELLVAKSFAVYSHSFQPGEAYRENFNIPPDRKILLLALSSFDESFAANVVGKFPDRKVYSPVFSSHFDWVRKTIEHFSGREDVSLVIRLHPRDFPNKRESNESEQLKEWRELLEDLPPNVAVDWPWDNISLYAAFSDIDVLTTGWSATGVEALATGIPVVTYDSELTSFPGDIHYTGTNEKIYFRNIEQALVTGRQISYARDAFLWLAVSYSLGTLRLSPSPRQIGGESRAKKLVPGWLLKTPVFLGYCTRRLRDDRERKRWRAFLEDPNADDLFVEAQRRADGAQRQYGAQLISSADKLHKDFCDAIGAPPQN